MNKLLKALLFTTLTMTSIYSFAATTTENKDDGSAIGTSDSPQVQRQESRTDKGAMGVNQDGVKDDASNLGNSESPQVVKQNKRTNKKASGTHVKHSHKNKVEKERESNAGTTKGNPAQPSEPEQGTPAAN